ncbi:MCE family protein [Acidiferrimicrobium sp. IK]|uniref:MCE family protein n=1 Tax=Acidiferrimicrobium sp. IK TaxID=2871700 RepID=UPI0021CB0753|nr:MlaD family protein [Acidiferrimicrobium sp. IK]MCU4186141.1 MCE family protein [Acidiferrimicrobium sp. IK]
MIAKIVTRLFLLAAIIAAGLGYILFGVLGFRLGAQPYKVTVNLPRSGGLYSGAYVAYRGVDVGRVSGLSITRDGVAASLTINPGARIPVASTVAVRDLSAVGEQYVDFTPTAAASAQSGPWLHAGSRIAVGASGVPVNLEQVLTDAGNFTNSINTKAFGQLLDSVSTAVQGSGPDLRNALDATERLFSTLETVQPQTSTLITSGQQLLATAKVTNPDIASLAANLAALTAQLDTSSGDIKSLLANGVSAGGQLQSLLNADSSALVSLTAHSATVANVFAQHDPAVQALLQVLPTVTAALGSTVSNGVVHTHFFIDDADPVCTYANAPLGEPTARSAPVDLSRTCTVSAPNLQQRGSANAPQP